MKASKTENQFETGFQQMKTGFPINGINIPTLHMIIFMLLLKATI